MRTREQQRRLVALGVDGREDRDIDIACRALEQPRGLLLRPGETELMSR
jgi:hypothetical protein